MICEIGRTLPTMPTILPTIASRPDVSISIHEGAVPFGVVMVMSQRPISLTSRGSGAAGWVVGEVAAPDARPAINKAKNRVIWKLILRRVRPTMACRHTGCRDRNDPAL